MPVAFLAWSPAWNTMFISRLRHLASGWRGLNAPRWPFRETRLPQGVRDSSFAPVPPLESSLEGVWYFNDPSTHPHYSMSFMRHTLRFPRRSLACSAAKEFYAQTTACNISSIRIRD
ncbi:hypothetical protein L209DRAFT_107372 [Thermothelomyces heterothallicus CBS 203.75]